MTNEEIVNYFKDREKELIIGMELIEAAKQNAYPRRALKPQFQPPDQSFPAPLKVKCVMKKDAYGCKSKMCTACAAT